MHYTAKIDKQDGVWIVEFPDKPNVNTYGENLEHALAMAEEALNAALESELTQGFPLVEPRTKAKGHGLYAIQGSHRGHRRWEDKAHPSRASAMGGLGHDPCLEVSYRLQQWAQRPNSRQRRQSSWNHPTGLPEARRGARQPNRSHSLQNREGAGQKPGDPVRLEAVR